MRIRGVARHLYRRYTLAMAVYMLLVAAIALGTALMLSAQPGQIKLVLLEDGRMAVEKTLTGFVLRENLGALIGMDSFSVAIFALALIVTRRDREMLIGMSVTRWEILLGSGAFLFSLSALVALSGVFVLPVICRAILWIANFPVAGGWDINALLTGRRPAAQLLSDAALGACGMISTAGLTTLFGYILLRWWKALALALGALVVLVIVLTTQVQIAVYLRSISGQLITWAQRAVERLLPAILDYLEGARLSPLRQALTDLGLGLAGAVISYPVMLGLKVR